MRVEWEVDGQLKKAALPHVKRWAKRAPSWCYVLYVCKGQTTDALATITPSFGYRRACMYVHPPFLEESEAGRSEAILHEILEIHLAPLRDVAKKLVESTPYADDAKLRANALDEILTAGEGAVQDLMLVLRDAV